MALRRSPRSFFVLAFPELAIGALLVAAPRPAHPPAPAAFAVRYRNVDSPHPVRALTVLPGETVTFEVVVAERGAGAGYVARPVAGRIVPLDAGRWEWTAPPTPGLYPIQVLAPDGAEPVTLQAFVVVPHDRIEGEFLNGYRIGPYPRPPAPGGAGHGPPAGFVEVTRENENVLISPHFRLKQFLCKQAAGYPKYVVLDDRLLLALEHVLQVVNEAGYRATTFHVMSGYRTPAYNRSLGNVRYSQHLWGAAADIFIDEDLNGVMDDLTGDGRSDIRDAAVLYRLIERAAATPAAQGLIGGLGKYPSTAAHGPFVHVDVRDGTARW